MQIALAAIVAVLLIGGGMFFILHDNTGLVGEWERRVVDTGSPIHDEGVVIVRFNRNQSGAMTSIFHSSHDPELELKFLRDFTWELSGSNQIRYTFQREDGTFHESGLLDFSVYQNVLILGDAVYTRR